tara:strand:+ start:7670 stop:10201 length:2532 start_codon:yes stop_codon:yes gene_type:complete
MNINLVSPVENGNNFVIRFKEDIIIPEQSKVYLNFASLSRENDVELYDDQTIKILINQVDVRPNKNTLTPFADASPLANDTITIPAGTYNYQRLYKKITDLINTELTNVSNPMDLSQYKAVGIADIDNTHDQIVAGNVSLSLGIMKANHTDKPHTEIVIDANNKVNGQGDTDEAYIKTTADAYVPSDVQSITGLYQGSGQHTNGAYTDIATINETATTRTTGTPCDNLLTVDFNVRDIPTNHNNFVTGTMDKTDGNYTDEPTSNSGLAGGLMVNYTVAAGAIDQSSIVLVDTDITGDYTVGDTITIESTTGTNDTTFDVSSLEQLITQLTITNGGPEGVGYFVNDELTINGGGGPNDATVNVLTLGSPASNQPYYDNYGLSEQHYWNYGYDDDTPFNELNIISFLSKNNIDDMMAINSKVVIGLWSREVATGINATEGNYPANSASRTRGTNQVNGTERNPKNLPADSSAGAKVLASWMNITIDCSGATPYLKCFVARKNNTGSYATNGLHTFDSCNQNISGMANILGGNSHGIKMSDIKGFLTENQFRGGIQLYYAMDDMGNRNVYFRLLNLNTAIDGTKSIRENGASILYDSKDKAHGLLTHFPDVFFNCINNDVDYETGTDDQKTNKINSQMPFNVITSALKINDGFETINGPFFQKSDFSPVCSILQYELEGSDEISRYLGLRTAADRINGFSQPLFPNTGDAMNPNILHITGMNLDWRNESYSIMINELPIKNYKNNDKMRNGGFAKNILANCPVPFSDAQSYSTKSKQMITSTYKPNYQIVNNLYNQQLTTNKFSIEIRKLASDKPATEILKSVINFTIVPPDSFNGNLNSISSLNA